MKSATVFRRALFLMLMVMLCSIVIQPATPSAAQEPVQSEPTQSTSSATTSFVGAVRDDANTQTTPPVRMPAEDEISSPDAGAQDEATNAVIPEPPTVALAPNATTVLTKQMSLNISVAETVRASEYITYEYRYRNNATTATSNLVIDLVWFSFSYGNSGELQWCPPAAPDIENCGFIKNSVVGPAVTFVDIVPNGVRFKIASLPAGQEGKFRFRLKINNSSYPTTLNPNGVGPYRPSGSARLFVDNDPKPLEATATSLVIGPIFTITKVAQQNKVLYPLETGTFTITLGNTTGSGDTVNGVRRIDARPATNVVLLDRLPEDAELVSSNLPNTYDPATRYIKWIFPTLEVGEQKQIVIVFRKKDIAYNCGNLANTSYGVTSNEIPRDTNNNIQYVGNQGASYEVLTPLVVAGLNFTPNDLTYGGVGTYSFKVASYWDKPITGLKVRVVLPSTQTYVVNTATPTPTLTPTPGQPGGVLEWTFDLPAAPQRKVFVEKTFSFKVNVGFANPNEGTIQIITPNGSAIPTACTEVAKFLVNPRPRIALSMDVPAGTPTKYSDELYLVKRGQQFPYIVNILNRSSIAATVDKLSVRLPFGNGANFVYKNGSGFVGDVAREPNVVTGQDGATYLEWTNINVPANSVVKVYYSAFVNGFDYIDYCTLPYATVGSENIDRESPQKICVKINPNIAMEKTTTSTTVRRGDLVEFKLKWTNLENSSYTFSPVDYLGDFVFESQSSNLGFTLGGNGSRVIWDQTTLASGQSIQITLRAKVPNYPVCQPFNLVNELGFLTTDNYFIVGVPPVVAAVKLTCSAIRFGLDVERSTVSLEDYFWYEMRFENIDTVSPSGIVSVTNILPLNFRFLKVDVTSELQVAPTSTVDSKGQTRLYWTLPAVPAGQTVRLKFLVRSGNVAERNIYNIMFATQSNGESTCTGSCTVFPVDGVERQIAYRGVNTEALMTLDPAINPTSCVKPGDVVNYKVTLTNRNSAHGYNDTKLTVTMPAGVSYVSAVGALAPSSIAYDTNGNLQVYWPKITVLKNPINDNQGIGTVMVVEIKVKIGNVWGDISPLAQATSVYGAIPERDPNVRPTIKVCPASPAIAKMVSRPIVRIGESVVYQITLANPNASAVTATVQDVLPTGMVFDGMVTGAAPTQNGNTLTWNVTIPAAAQQGSAGLIVLRFKAKVTQATVGQSLVNTATVTQSSVPIATSVNGVAVNVATIKIARVVFLPMVIR